MKAKFINEYLDDFYENQLLEYLINEDLNYDNIKNIVSKIKDKKTALLNLIKKFNKSHNLNTKKYIAGILVILFLSSFAYKNNKWNIKSGHTIDRAALDISKNDTINLNYINDYFEISQKEIYKDPSELKVSKEAINLIKKHEALRLKAYYINDKKISIGYGHAEDSLTSKYKLGDRISIEEANRLFKNDLVKKEEGVQRMFRQWKERGVDIKITQNMYDAIISIAYNTGISGLRNSAFAEYLESGNFEKAANLIKSTRVNKKKYPGLEKRRQDEHELFSKDMT